MHFTEKLSKSYACDANIKKPAFRFRAENRLPGTAQSILKTVPACFLQPSEVHLEKDLLMR